MWDPINFGMWSIKSHIFLMKSREVSTISTSCYWAGADVEEESACPYPDKFAIDFSIPFQLSREDFILDCNDGEERDPLYRLRCCLYLYCVDRIDSLVVEEVNHTTDKCVFLIKTFLRSVTMYNLALESLILEIIRAAMFYPYLYCYWTHQLTNMFKRTFLVLLPIVKRVLDSILSS